MGFFDDIGITVADSFDEAYANAPVKRIHVDLPDGYYTGYIEDFRLMKAVNGKIYLRVSFVVMSTTWEGYLATKWSLIDMDDPERTARKLKTDMMILRYDWKGIRSLGDQRKWEKIRDSVVQFQVTHRMSRNGGSYMNIWPRRVLGKITPEEKEKYRAREELLPE